MTPADVIAELERGMCHGAEKRLECEHCTRRLRAIEAVRRMGARDAALTDVARGMPGDTLRWDEEVDVIHAHVPAVVARIAALEARIAALEAVAEAADSLVCEPTSAVRLGAVAASLRRHAEQGRELTAADFRDAVADAMVGVVRDARERRGGA